MAQRSYPAIFDDSTGIGWMQVASGRYQAARSPEEFDRFLRAMNTQPHHTNHPPKTTVSGYDVPQRTELPPTGREDTQTFGMPSTGDPNLDEMQNKMVEAYQRLIDRGMQIDPYVEITPDKAAEFLSQAEKELEPYYASQFKLAKENLLYQQGYTEDEIIRKEQEFEENYSRSLRSLSESMAERGFAYSGVRGRKERELATEAQRTMEAPRRQFAHQAGLAAREFGRLYGERGLQELGVPTMAEVPRALPGTAQFQRTGRQLPLYQLPTGVYEGLVGEREKERKAAEIGMAETAKRGFREEELTKRYRKLTL